MDKLKGSHQDKIKRSLAKTIHETKEGHYSLKWCFVRGAVLLVALLITLKSVKDIYRCQILKKNSQNLFFFKWNHHRQIYQNN